MPNDGTESTYFIDAENAAEMARLRNQDRLTTKVMGGLFSERSDLAGIHNVLDIACGPGGWALDVAQAYPHMQVTGVDISELMIEYARSQVLKQELPNVSFRVMNVLEPLDFADSSFDLVNARFISGFLSPASWPTLLQECRRILRPGGMLRVTDGEVPITTSISLSRLWGFLTQALKQAGQSFSADGRNVGITPVLGRLLRNAGYVHIQTMACGVDASAGTEAHSGLYQDMMVTFKLLQPFLLKMGVTTQEEVETLYHRALAEMQAEDFCSVGFLLIVTGKKPGEYKEELR